jgi:hypothetical protein
MMLLGLAVAAPASAQPKKDKEKPATVQTSREILSSLQVEVDTANLKNESLKLAEWLDVIRDALQKKGREIAFNVDEETYRDESPDAPKILEAQVTFKSLPPKTTVSLLLRRALNQLPIPSTFIVRAGRVDIVPQSRATKAYMLNQTFHVDFKDRPLSAALEELSELTGVSLVMDARVNVKEKAQTPVTARFHDDVALQDAVRMLTDMAELKIVYLVTGLYVTTPEHAAAMQKELKQIYETPANIPAGFGPAPPGGGMGVPPGGGPTPQMQIIPSAPSPLAPPLPPSRQPREQAA